MSNLLVSRVSFGENYINKNVSKTQSSEQNLEDKKLSNNTKFLIGLSAVSAAVVGGLLIKHNININALKKQINDISKRIENSISINEQNSDYSRLFDSQITRKYLKDAEALPLKDKLNNLKDIDGILSYGIMFKNKLLRDMAYSNRPFYNSLPLDTKKAIGDKDLIKAVKLYKEYISNYSLNSKTMGKSIKESITNVFGNTSFVKSHTYDLTKESDSISLMMYEGGYHSAHIKKNGKIIPEGNKDCVSYNVYRNGNANFNPDGGNGQTYTNIKNEQITIQDGIAKNGKRYVTLLFPNIATDTERTEVGISVLSRDDKLTPAQKDLLSLKDKIITNEMHKLLSISVKKTENLNYDAILSLIQSIAK